MSLVNTRFGAHAISALGTLVFGFAMLGAALPLPHLA